MTNRSSNSVSVIETATNTVAATVSVGLDPEGVAISPDGYHAYVTTHSTGTVSVIALASNTVVAVVPVGLDPSDVAIGDPDTDGDGIYNDVDADPLSASVNLSDSALGGTTTARVHNLDPGITVKITDAPDPALGFRVIVSGPAGGVAAFKIKNSSGTYYFTPGKHILTKGSVTLDVLQGSAEAEFTIKGTLVVVAVDAGGTVRFEETIEAGELLGFDLTAVKGAVTINNAVVLPGETLTIDLMETQIGCSPITVVRCK